LGYDNTLESSIGITIIATGFEHHDPFVIQPGQQHQKTESKVTVPLRTEAPAPVTLKTEAPAQVKTEEVVSFFKMPAEEPAIPSELMPQLATPPEQTETKENDEAPLYFELSIDAAAETEQPLSSASDLFEESGETSTLSSGGYLVKPSQIYAEGYREPESDTKNQEPSRQQEEEPVLEMHLVVKPQKAAEEKPSVQQTQPIMMSPVEEPAMQDEAEELRRRAMERIAKLRNLSYNINAADPNNEFETVPAYLRRNMDINSQVSNVESFYSNYSVKNNENNQTEISRINTFLDGKKPD
jgi:cell division protein FtsZ